MPKGVAENRIKLSGITESQLTAVFDRSRYKETTKQALRSVLLEGKSYHSAGASFGLSRQFVFRRAKEVLQKAGIDTSLPAA